MNPSDPIKEPGSNHKTPGQLPGVAAFVIAAAVYLVGIWAMFAEFRNSWEYQSGGSSILRAVPKSLPYFIAFGASLLGVRYAWQGSRKATYMAFIVVGIAVLAVCILLCLIIAQGGRGWH